MKWLLFVFLGLSVIGLAYTPMAFAQEDDEEVEEGIAPEAPDEADYEEEEEFDEPARVNRGGGSRGRFSGSRSAAPRRGRSERSIVRGRNTFSEPSKVKFFRSGKKLKVKAMSYQERRKLLLEKQKEALQNLDE